VLGDVDEVVIQTQSVTQALEELTPASEMVAGPGPVE
jgi:hypothetical protein